MVNRYNLSNLQASFRNYLLAEINSRLTVKNYLSDFRHFTAWLLFFIDNSALFEDSEDSLVSFITEQTILDYREYLMQNKLPYKTINRRLSTLRKFCTFCINQGWMKNNPAKKVTNIKNQRDLSSGQILAEFKNYLEEKDLPPLTIKIYQNTIQEILQI